VLAHKPRQPQLQVNKTLGGGFLKADSQICYTIKVFKQGDETMRLLKMGFVLVLVLSATSVFAQVDPDPNGIGIYFDQGATVNSTVIAEGTDVVNAYLVLTNPSLEGNLDYWYCYVSTYLDDPNQGASIAGHPVNGTNIIVSNMPGSSSWGFRVFPYSEPPLEATFTTVLAELEILIFDFNSPIYLYVRGSGDEVVYSVGTESASMNPSSGSWDLPVAVINGEAPVATESQSWGQLKSLYR